jgi:hypothetical protein
MIILKNLHHDFILIKHLLNKKKKFIENLFKLRIMRLMINVNIINLIIQNIIINNYLFSSKLWHKSNELNLI